jgi:hypothetical protein
VVSELAHAFATGTPNLQREILRDRRAELLDPEVATNLQERAETADHRYFDGALALIRLVAIEEDELLNKLVSADDEAQLLAIARETAAHDGAGVIGNASLYAISRATDTHAYATCLICLALAAILDEETEVAAGYVDQARTLDPDARHGWIDLLAELSDTQPKAARLIPMVNAPIAQTVEDAT